MAATLAQTKIFEAFLANAADAKQFFHGHTFGGNPLAAAAAIASIDLLQQPELLESVNTKAKQLRERLNRLVKHPNVGDIRGRGFMVGIEIVADRQTRASFPSTTQLGRRICKRALDHGVWIRPLGDVIILMPPLAIGDEQLATLSNAVIQSIEQELASDKADAARLLSSR